MNRIIIIGNGFDLAHGLETKYEHFLKWLKNDILTSYDSKGFIDYFELDNGNKELTIEATHKDFLLVRN